MKVLPENTMIDNLEKIKQILDKMSSDDVKNVVFINLNGLFKYITDMNYTDSYGKNNIRCLFESISPYIPISVNEENLAKALKAAFAVNSAEKARIDESFDNFSKIRFLNRISLAKTEKEWNDIIDVCKTIRGYIENTHFS